jgi:hypothetical protein
MKETKFEWVEVPPKSLVLNIRPLCVGLVAIIKPEKQRYTWFIYPIPNFGILGKDGKSNSVGSAKRAVQKHILSEVSRVQYCLSDFNRTLP